MNFETFNIIFRLTVCSTCIPLFVYLRRFRKASKEIKLIGAVTAASIFFDLAGYITGLYFKTSTITNNLYNIISFTLLSWFYFEIFFKRRYKPLFIIGIGIFILAFLIITFFIQNFIHEHQTFLWATGEFILVVYGIMFMNDQVSVFPLKKLYTSGLFWINNAILIYNSFTFYIFLMSEYNFKHMPMETVLLMWSFHNMCRIVQNGFYALGIYYSQQQIRMSQMDSGETMRFSSKINQREPTIRR